MPPARQRSLNKADTGALLAKRSSIRKTNAKTKNLQNKEPISASKANAIVPGADVAFKALLSARICAAIWSHVTDCDETFNYWEPLHYLMYGRGLQTWEYSPEFALRSYTYLLSHGVPAFIYNRIFTTNPMLLFYFVRIMLALMCAIVEVYFYKAVSREFGIQIGRLWLLFQLFSPGMFIASTAFLPSSFSMYLCSAALAAWWHQQYRLAVFFTCISAFLGWPFAALIGLPICFDMLFRQKMYRTFIIWSIISAATIAIPMIVIDSSYFGKIVFAPLNIVLYNVFTSHGPDLYGTEPFYFYFINGFLNFNIIWLMALITPIMLIIAYFLVPAKSKPTLYLPYYLSLAPFYIWLLIFTIQPHKEERFLFPIYFLIALCGAITMDIVQKLYFRLKSWFFSLPSGTHYLDHTAWIAAIVMILTTLLSLSKIFSLYYNYHAPLDLMMELNTQYRSPDNPLIPDATYNVCVGKDWHRFPNSFFLPNEQFRIRFLKSEFKGILPAYFNESNDNDEDGSTIIHSYFNDQNRENEEMYFDYRNCQFLLDLNTGRYTENEPNYAERTNEWTVLKTLPFLNAQESNQFFRTFYIPYFTEQNVVYSDFNLLKRKIMFQSMNGNINKQKTSNLVDDNDGDNDQ